MIMERNSEFTAFKPISDSAIPKDPFELFKIWQKSYVCPESMFPSAFTLSTISLDGSPNSRVVALKQITKQNEFVFATNYESEKGLEIARDNRVALCFYWGDRQIRVKGRAFLSNDEMSDHLFNDRIRESQLSAWASDQSKTIASKTELIEKLDHYREKFDAMQVPRPKNWGGYRIKAEYFEFWQGGLGRLHDRFAYEEIDSNWRIKRLQP